MELIFKFLYQANISMKHLLPQIPTMHVDFLIPRLVIGYTLEFCQYIDSHW
jgi:hypothetical protein